jgi:hypothetical protein
MRLQVPQHSLQPLPVADNHARKVIQILKFEKQAT